MSDLTDLFENIDEIANLFGNPEDNPNFKPGEAFNTGFKACGYIPFAQIFDQDDNNTEYYLAGYDCGTISLIDSEGKIIGYFCGYEPWAQLFDLKNRKTNFFLQGFEPHAIIMYLTEKSSKKE